MKNMRILTISFFVLASVFYGSLLNAQEKKVVTEPRKAVGVASTGVVHGGTAGLAWTISEGKSTRLILKKHFNVESVTKFHTDINTDFVRQRDRSNWHSKFGNSFVERFQRDHESIDLVMPGYDGLHAEEPADGMYIDPNGSPLFLLKGEVVATAEALVSALGRRAEDLMEQTGQAETVLERLGMVY